MKAIRKCYMAAALAAVLAAASVQAQEAEHARGQSRDDAVMLSLDHVSLSKDVALSDVSQTHSQDQNPPGATKPTNGQSSLPDAPTPTISHPDSDNSNDQVGKQPKRILGIVPNFRAVSANTQLPPLDFKSKLWLATQDTFDYSNFIFVGGLAGISMASKSQPTFGQGAEGFGKYYWHTFVDGGIENYMTEAIVPVITRQDPRYYTLGEGGFFKRTGYAVSRLVITRTNSGRSTFNFSEIVGAGAAAGIGNLYYPKESNPWVKTYQRWGTQVGLDGLFNVLKEFWPDIDRAIFRGKY